MSPAKAKAKADNSYEELDFGYSCKTESTNRFFIHFFEENNDKHTIARKQIDIVLGHHALRIQTTD